MADVDAALREAVDRLLAALNQPDPSAVRAACTEAGWLLAQGRLRAEPDQFARFPATLVNGDRAAVRAMSAPAAGNDRPDPLWLCLARTGAAWKLDAAFDTREQAQGWLANAAVAVDPSDDLVGAVEAVARAVAARDEAALRAACTDGAWASDASPARMLRFAARGDVQLAPTGPARAAGGRAAVPMTWVVGGEPMDRLWLLLSHEGGWRLEGQVEDDAVAALFVRGVVAGVPTWSSLPEAEEARAFVEAALPHVGGAAPPPAGSDAGAWAELIAPGEEGLTLRVGEARAMPGVGRALVQLGFYGAEDPDYAEEDRWALLERGEGGWRLVATRYLRGVATLLEGLDLDFPAEGAPAPRATRAPGPDPTAAASAAQEALQARMRALFADHGVKLGPDGKPDLASLSEGQLRALGPQLVGDLFGGLAAALGGVPAPEAQPEPGPEVVDLAAERARRGQRAPVDVENDIGRKVQEALSGFVGQKAGSSDKLRVDADFVKEDGARLAATLFGAIAKALVPENLKVPVAVPGAADAPADPLRDELNAADREAGQRTVDLELDLGSLIGGLFASAMQRGAAQPPAPGADSERTDSAPAEDDDEA